MFSSINKRPQKLGKKFADMFYESWASAYESLKPKNSEPVADDNDEMAPQIKVIS
jgi:hypothetical protein